MATEAQLISALRQADAAGDHAGATRIAQIIQAQRGGAPVTGGGLAASFGSGIVRGVTGLSDALNPGNLGATVGGAVDQATKIGGWVGAKTGLITPQQGDQAVAAEQQARRGTPLETSTEQVNRSGVLHNAQNGAERIAEETGQFIPNALGPGGPVRATARVVAPVVAGNALEAGARAVGAPGWVQRGAHVIGNIAGGFAPEAAAGAVNAGTAGVLGRSENVSPEIAALAKVAQEKHGIVLRSDQIAGAGPGGDRAALVRDSNLISSNKDFRASQLAQRQAFTTAAGKTFGAEGPLTTDAMAAARQRLSAGFQAHAAANGVAADDTLMTDLARVGSQARELGLPDNEVRALDGQISKIADLASVHEKSGVIPGDAYQSLTQKGSALDKIMNAPHGSYGNLGSDIRTALSDAAARAGGPEGVAQLADLRAKWANMKTVEPLAEKAGPDGLINPALLQGRVNTVFDNAAYGSGGVLKELGDIGQTFLKEPGSSQTSERWFDRAKGPAAAAGLAEAIQMGAHDPAALLTTAGSAAAGYAANKGLAALKAARSNNPVATNALLSGTAGPMPARIINALAGDNALSYVPRASITGALGLPNAFGEQTPSGQ